MNARLVLLLAVVCGVAVGNVYFPQSIAPAVAAGLHVSAGAAAGIVTAVQVGYTAGSYAMRPRLSRRMRLPPRSAPWAPS